MALLPLHAPITDVGLIELEATLRRAADGCAHATCTIPDATVLALIDRLRGAEAVKDAFDGVPRADIEVAAKQLIMQANAVQTNDAPSAKSMYRVAGALRRLGFRRP